jgi:HSP20 family protein
MVEQQNQTTSEKSRQDSSAETQQPQSGAVTQSRMSSLLPFAPFTPYDVFAGGPFQFMRRMMEEMDRLVEAINPSLVSGGTVASRLWSPAIEVARRDGSLVIRAELPGLSKDDVKVELTPDGLLIQGERKEEHAEEQEGVLRSERRYGRFSRTIPLPDGANAEQAKAQFNNGVLEVTIPVPETKVRRREIPIEDNRAPMAQAA